MDRERRRAQILEVAKTVFAEKGYHEAKIDDIVARARVARGTFYLYFGDKRAIFEEIVDLLVVRITEELSPVRLSSPGGPPVVQLTENVRRIVRLFTDDPAMAKILFSDAVGLDPDFDRKLLAFYDQISQVLRHSLDEGVAEGIVHAGDNQIRAYCLMGVVKELLHQISLRRSEVDPERIIAAVIELVGSGILTDAARTGRG